jgi:hypothetical protein
MKATTMSHNVNEITQGLVWDAQYRVIAYRDAASVLSKDDEMR